MASEKLEKIAAVYRVAVLGFLMRLPYGLSEADAAAAYDAAPIEAFDDKAPKECADYIMEHRP